MTFIGLAREMNDLARRLRVLVKEDFEGAHPAHDLSHLDRVYGLAQRLWQREGGDPTVITAASYLHDFHRISSEAEAASEKIGGVLADAHVPSHKRQRILDCVRLTRAYSFADADLRDIPLEARIVRDADNLDALGALGVARAFMFGGLLGEQMWVPGEPIRERYTAGHAPSVIHHFYEKLLKLREDMQTATGRALASERHEFLTEFITRFEAEWEFAMQMAVDALPVSAPEAPSETDLRI